MGMNISSGMLYPALPFLAWLCSGTLKYIINRLLYGAEAKQHIGNGGFPSTHTSMISSIALLIGFEQGWGTPLFGLAIAITCIVMLDALGIRRAVGENARWINLLSKGEAQLREKQGHRRMEVAGGLAVGTLLAWFASMIL
jgi:acid phosphatase family membrane protein YuiD